MLTFAPQISLRFRKFPSPPHVTIASDTLLRSRPRRPIIPPILRYRSAPLASQQLSQEEKRAADGQRTADSFFPSPLAALRNSEFDFLGLPSMTRQCQTPADAIISVFAPPSGKKRLLKDLRNGSPITARPRPFEGALSLRPG